MAERINADMDWTQYTREFEMNLRRIRAQRGYSQERVAYDAGMSRSAREVTEGNSQSCQFIARTDIPQKLLLQSYLRRL